MAGHASTEQAAVAAVAAPTIGRAAFAALNDHFNCLTATQRDIGEILGDLYRLDGMPESWRDHVQEAWALINSELNHVIGQGLALQLNTIQAQKGTRRVAV